jgi:hypothetical protein
MQSMLEAAKPSRTALGVAIRRASRQLYDSLPLVLEDPIAIPILGDIYRPALEDAAASINDRFHSRCERGLLPGTGMLKISSLRLSAGASGNMCCSAQG